LNLSAWTVEPRTVDQRDRRCVRAAFRHHPAQRPLH